MGYVVVGVDGSPDSEQALRFALAEARRREATLRVVCAWHVPAMAYAGGFPPPQLEEVLSDDAVRALEDSLASVDAEQAGVEIERHTPRGQPARMLLDLAEGAEMLVVGSRGRGGFTSLLLGSVSQQCAEHARCPLVIVRAPS